MPRGDSLRASEIATLRSLELLGSTTDLRGFRLRLRFDLDFGLISAFIHQDFGLDFGWIRFDSASGLIWRDSGLILLWISDSLPLVASTLLPS